MDKFDEIFSMQNYLDTKIATERGLSYTKDEWLQKEILAMLSELTELLDETNFKWWKNKKELNEANIKGELIDILHFFVSMCLKLGMDANEVYLIYIKKNEENFKRQQGLTSKKGYCLDEN